MIELSHVDYASVLSHVLYYENAMWSKYLSRKLGIKKLSVEHLNEMHAFPIKYEKIKTLDYNYSRLIELAVEPSSTLPVYMDDVPMLDICKYYRTPCLKSVYQATAEDVVLATRNLKTVTVGYVSLFDYHRLRKESLHSYTYANYGTSAYAQHMAIQTYEG